MFLLMFYHPFAQTHYASLRLANIKNDVYLGPSAFVHTLSTIVVFFTVLNMFLSVSGHLRLSSSQNAMFCAHPIVY